MSLKHRNQATADRKIFNGKPRDIVIRKLRGGRVCDRTDSEKASLAGVPTAPLFNFPKHYPEITERKEALCRAYSSSAGVAKI